MSRRTSRWVIAIAAWAAVVAAGCGNAKPPSPPPPEAQGPYVLEPGDTLALRFNRNPELNEEAVIIRPDGMISVQLIEEVQAAGKTPAALGAELQQRYAAELAHPEVKVIVKTFTTHRVSIAGEVGDPGIQPLMHGLTLSQAIHHAGGFLKTANRDQVVVLRRHADGTVTGHIVDLKPVEAGERPQDDIALRPLDQVYVPRSEIADVNVVIEQYIRNNLPVSSLGVGITPF